MMDVATLCFGWYVVNGRTDKMPLKSEDTYNKDGYVILTTDCKTYSAKPIYHQNGEIMGWIPTDGSITDLIPVGSVYAYSTLNIPDGLRNRLRSDRQIPVRTETQMSHKPATRHSQPKKGIKHACQIRQY